MMGIILTDKRKNEIRGQIKTDKRLLSFGTTMLQE